MFGFTCCRRETLQFFLSVPSEWAHPGVVGSMPPFQNFVVPRCWLVKPPVWYIPLPKINNDKIALIKIPKTDYSVHLLWNFHHFGGNTTMSPIKYFSEDPQDWVQSQGFVIFSVVSWNGGGYCTPKSSMFNHMLMLFSWDFPFQTKITKHLGDPCDYGTAHIFSPEVPSFGWRSNASRSNPTSPTGTGHGVLDTSSIFIDFHHSKRKILSLWRVVE